MARIELTIERLSQLGDGVARFQGRTVFVEGALPGERVSAEVLPRGKVLRAEEVELLSRSARRREPPCALFGRCGGCDWLHAEDGLQREAKEEIVLSELAHLAGISRSEIQVRPQAVSPHSLGYRRRAVMRFFEGDLGFSERRSRRGVAVDHCPALSGALAHLPGRLGPLLRRQAKEIEAVTLLSVGDEAAIAVGLLEPAKPRHVQAAEQAVQELGLSGAVLVLREGAVRHVGSPVLRAVQPLCPGVPLYLRPDVFAQANAEANAELVSSAAVLLGAKDGDRVLELYAGNGNFTFPLAATSGSVLAVESSGAAVELSRRSAREGRVVNVRLVQGDVAKVCRGLCAEGERFDLLLLDPPRMGASGVGAWAKKLSVRGVVYVSCHPASLARDAKELLAAGFRPRSLQLVDMFPQTRHVEVVLSFEASG